MWERDWALLGIEPTPELAAIKKAYALKLKATRPDDDAEAYQALRAAYERAQQWAKWQTQPVADEPAAATGSPAVQPPQAPAAPAQQDAEIHPTAADISTPQALIDSLELAWRRHGPPGLEATWGRVQKELLTQPLETRGLHSSAFAQWVVKLPQLPDDFVARLDAEFRWRDDYRTRHMLGNALAEDLEEAMNARWPRALNDAGLLARARPLLKLYDRLRAGRHASALLMMVLLHPGMLRELAQIGPATLRRLGLELGDQSRLNTLVGQAGLLRVAMAVAVFIGCGLAMGVAGVPLLTRALTWTVCGGMALGAAYTAGALLANPPGRAGRWLRAWAMPRRQPVLGLCLLAAAAFLAYFNVAGTQLLQAGGTGSGGAGPDGFTTVALGLLGLAGLTGAWPRHPEHGITCVGLIVLGWLILITGLPADGPGGAALWACALGVLLGAASAEGRLHLPAPLTWLLRPVTNSLDMSRAWGPVFSLLPAVAVLGYAMIPETWVSPMRLFAVWVVSLLVLAQAQARAEAWALRKLNRD